VLPTEKSYVGSTSIVKKISGANLVDGSTSLWLELTKMSPF